MLDAEVGTLGLDGERRAEGVVAELHIALDFDEHAAPELEVDDVERFLDRVVHDGVARAEHRRGWVEAGKVEALLEPEDAIRAGVLEPAPHGIDKDLRAVGNVLGDLRLGGAKELPDVVAAVLRIPERLLGELVRRGSLIRKGGRGEWRHGGDERHRAGAVDPAMRDRRAEGRMGAASVGGGRHEGSIPSAFWSTAGHSATGISVAERTP